MTKTLFNGNKNYNLSANEGFAIFLTSKLITLFIGHFEIEIPVSCLFAQWK